MVEECAARDAAPLLPQGGRVLVENVTRSIRTRVSHFKDRLCAADRELRRAGHTVPSKLACTELKELLFELVDYIEIHVLQETLAYSEAKDVVEEILGPILWRSELFWRSRYKPYGYAGDFKIVEMMYDLEETAGLDPLKATMVNILDYSFASVHSVIGIWNRRRTLRRLIRREFERVGPGFSIMDFACGGSRYIHDELAAGTEAVRIDLVDQDPCALAFAAGRLNTAQGLSVTAHCSSILRFAGSDNGRRYDLIVAAGVFDYVKADLARKLLVRLAERLNPSGLLVLSNYGPGDRSAFFKRLVVDWPLIFRSGPEVSDLFPKSLKVESWLTDDGSLVFGAGRN